MTEEASKPEVPAVPNDTKNPLYCSFCGKSQHDVRSIIAGPTVFICNECSRLCSAICEENYYDNFVDSVKSLQATLIEGPKWARPPSDEALRRLTKKLMAMVKVIEEDAELNQSAPATEKA